MIAGRMNNNVITYPIAMQVQGKIIAKIAILLSFFIRSFLNFLTLLILICKPLVIYKAI